MTLKKDWDKRGARILRCRFDLQQEEIKWIKCKNVQGV